MAEIPENFVDNTAESVPLLFCNAPPRFQSDALGNRNAFAENRSPFRRDSQDDLPPVLPAPRAGKEPFFFETIGHPRDRRHIETI